MSVVTGYLSTSGSDLVTAKALSLSCTHIQLLKTPLQHGSTSLCFCSWFILLMLLARIAVPYKDAIT